MNEAIDYSTVKWVKQELDATLKQAQQALEAYVDHPDDESQLRFCAVHLHQVHGTLLMVELYGAALLVEEMEQVVQALLAGTVGQHQDAYELIMRAMLQLPDYLERLIAGGRDLPLVLLPLLNDLRAIRGQKLLSENSLFNPDLGIEMPIRARLEGEVSDFLATIRKQRHAYQLALLGWFRNNDVEANLDRLGSALGKIQAACLEEAGQRLWWIAGGLVAALRQGWLETSMATKLLLGQVDRQIKRIMDEGEAMFASSLPADLTKNLLFYVARAADGGDPVSLIKATYRLADLLPDSDELERAQGALSGHNADLMRTVSIAIKEDLARVKDALDLFLRGGRNATTDLAPASETLARVADTLGMLGLGSLRKVAQEQARAAAEMTATGKHQADEMALMNIASALLFIESSLDSLAQGGAPVQTSRPEMVSEEPAGGMSLPEAEFNLVRGVVAEEAIRDITAAKDAILGFMEKPTDFAILEKVPQLFNQVKGSLLLLNEARAAGLVDAVRIFLSGRVMAPKELPADASMDDLADAISSIEYYLENLREGRVFGATVLDVAASSMARLNGGAAVEASLAIMPGSASLEPGALDDDQNDFGTLRSGESSEEDIGVEVAAPGTMPESDPNAMDPFALSTNDPFVVGDHRIDAGDPLDIDLSVEPLDAVDLPLETDAVMATLGGQAVESGLSSLLAGTDSADAFVVEKWDAAGVSERDPLSLLDGEPADSIPVVEVGALAAEPGTPDREVLSDIPAAPVRMQAPELQVLAEDIDNEILEIFIEEAEEELVNIGGCIPRWIADESDRDALVTMRRSFHTLKGSGRLIGALRIGEFAWGYESMLNRLIEGAIPRSGELCGLLERALLALPELIAQIRGGATTVQPVEVLMDLAHAVGRGESVDLRGLDDAWTDGSYREMDAVPQLSGRSSDAEGGLQAFGGHLGPDLFAAMEAPTQPTHDWGGSSPIDPVLFEIFSHESLDHISTVQGFLDHCCAMGDECRITDDLMRALHTLHGSARMAGAELIAEIAYEIEKYGKALRNDQLPMSEEGRRLVTEALRTIERLLPQLQDPAGDLSDERELIRAIGQLPRTTADVSHIPSAEVPVDQGDGEQANALDAEEIVISASDVPGGVDELSFERPEILGADAGGGVVEEAEPLAWDAALADPFGGQGGLDLPGSEEPDAFSDRPISPRSESSSWEAPGAPAPTISVATVEDPFVRIDYAEMDADLLDVFLEEGDEILGSVDSALQRWMGAIDDSATTAELQRYLHTLKGGARMASLTAIGDLSHILESLLIAVVDGQLTPTETLFDLLLQAQDRLAHMLEAARAHRPMRSAATLIAKLEMLLTGGAQEDSVPDGSPVLSIVEEPALEPAAAQASEPEAKSLLTEASVAVRSQQELVRVRADLLDNMVNFAGEISIYRSRLEQQVGSMRFNLSELGQTVDRLRDQLRKLEIETEAQVLFRYERDGVDADEHFDPLEMDRYSHLQQLSRSMLEGIGDLVSIQGLLDNITRESETLLLQQARVNTELQEGLMRTRMVPFSGLAPRMRRILRQACQELGKRAELVLEGADGEMDRTVIDRIIAPIEHMLRNAIAHGIESQERRTAKGKKPTGTIKVSLSRESSEVVIKLADDGAGMNLDAIRRKARERGLMPEGAELGDNDVMQFVLETGFSTAEKVSQIAGRGVGMDVVNSEVKQLGGSLHIDSSEGQGTTFTIRLPFTLAISQALLVQVHEEIYAIPLTGIEGIVRLAQEELQRYYDDQTARFDYAGYSYQVQNLGVLLGQEMTAQGAGAAKRLPVLLVRSGEHRMALQVDSLLGSRETVVKSVGPQISTVRGISGATILGDGRVVLILDLGGLLRSGGVGVSVATSTPVTAPQARVLTVMVVDDSITVRKVTTRLLERNEMQVITAKDGVDAVTKLQEHIPDVMLLDIEMPRMDGFELATHVRNEPRLRGVPMIMITSRTGDKHRKRAMEIGVDRYLGKPYQESALLETIRELAEERRTNG